MILPMGVLLGVDLNVYYLVSQILANVRVQPGKIPGDGWQTGPVTGD